MKTAIITGLCGQDGTYLAELLLAENYRVIGGVRDTQKGLNQLPQNLAGYVELIEWNMLDQAVMEEALAKYKPNEVYNFAAYTSGSGMFDHPVKIAEINGLAVTRILEAIRKVDSKIHFCQASSREIFGEAVESPQTEKTITLPRSPYGAAKLYADSMVRIYRQHYGLFACSAILFNHESPRRSTGFVTRKITSEAVKIKLGLASKLHLGNLDTLRDWGFAGDYVYAMWKILQQQHPEDYVLATGVSHSVREFCKCAFDCLGLDYRDYVKEDTENYRPSELLPLVGNAEKAKRNLQWEPKVSFSELVAMMVESDLQIFSVEEASALTVKTTLGIEWKAST